MAVSANATAVSSGVTAESLDETGASFTELTMMVTLAVSVPPWPSSTENVTRSVPWKFGRIGVVVHDTPVQSSRPLNGPITGAVIVSGSPSTSEALSVKLAGVSSLVVTDVSRERQADR